MYIYPTYDTSKKEVKRLNSIRYAKKELKVARRRLNKGLISLKENPSSIVENAQLQFFLDDMKFKEGNLADAIERKERKRKFYA